MAFSFSELAVPLVGAPMAGGPSTPALAAAVSQAGGLGFVAGGYRTPEQLADDLTEARVATTGPTGVNLFVPQPSAADIVLLDEYAGLLDPLAEHYGVELGQPRFNDDDCWSEKLQVVAELRPTVVSFAFGTPTPDILELLRSQRILTVVTVTSAYEAGVAVGHGAEALVVQGPNAGGHRGTFAPDTLPGTDSLENLLAQIGHAHPGVPLVAAGGLGTAADVSGVLRRGAVAAQVGTALLLAHEAGTNPTHRAALTNPEFVNTTVTCAFSGRYARSLENDFTRSFEDVAPVGYPEIHHMTSPIRAAAVAMDDPHGTSLWAGTSYRTARAARAADIIAGLAPR
ncbi:nitronate monooxygenase [Mycolicibacter hiberniae]|uniref:Propionate 3-nitronate monooxygenase n=1 Tax=Mycolicibacter hiberniae TaxID=29314 RepID=A0A7I7X416_9MYCO|nr:nitronate monooxygenase [Mycolicibacter hiberniae]MCV7087824.1 nitronate monooxygenase [Mycolicibacter hiberniae]ORV66769.1 2-nitropropane dioxygenase [Mycolicibacter hiberniae]BBZ23563.1 oxidoreductase [Mycolicibacter hiberniae]